MRTGLMMGHHSCVHGTVCFLAISAAFLSATVTCASSCNRRTDGGFCPLKPVIEGETGIEYDVTIHIRVSNTADASFIGYEATTGGTFWSDQQWDGPYKLEFIYQWISAYNIPACWRFKPEPGGSDYLSLSGDEIRLVCTAETNTDTITMRNTGPANVYEAVFVGTYQSADGSELYEVEVSNFQWQVGGCP